MTAGIGGKRGGVDHQVAAGVSCCQAPDWLTYPASIAAFVRTMLGEKRRARISFIEVLGASQRVEAHRRLVIRSFAS